MKPQMNPKATKVWICGTLYSRADKEPFVTSGHSVLGALEVSENETVIKCHECGRWFGQLAGKHMKTHGLTGEAYRRKHGLRLATGLCSPAILEKKSLRIKAMNADPAFRAQSVKHLRKAWQVQRSTTRKAACYLESANLKMLCRAQLTVRLTNLAAKLCRTPTALELKQVGDSFGTIDRYSVEVAFQMTYAEALRAIGLTPNAAGAQRIAAPIQLEILQLRAKGLGYQDIGRRLGVSQTTAFNYVRASG